MENSCARKNARIEKESFEGGGGLLGSRAPLREPSGNGSTRNRYGEHPAYSWGGAGRVHEGQLRSLYQEERSFK